MIDRPVLEAALALRRAGEPFVIATVVAVSGSAYRHPGARMLIARDRWVAGSVSGGCLEGDVRRRGWWQTEGRRPVVMTYDSTVAADADADALREGLGLGCNGIVNVLLERDGRGDLDALGFLVRCCETQQRGALVTVFESADPDLAIGDRIAVDAIGSCEGTLGRETIALVAAARRAIDVGKTTVCSAGPVRALIEVVVPPPRLFVLGAGHDAVPVVELGRSLGWEVFACAASMRSDLRTRFAHADHLLCGGPEVVLPLIAGSDRPVAVVMNHNYERDLACVDALLGSQARYIGVLGPRHRTVTMLGELGRAADDPRLYAPVGLALGAESPGEIALAIIAEIQAALAAVEATSLRDGREPIHAR